MELEKHRVLDAIVLDSVLSLTHEMRVLHADRSYHFRWNHEAAV